MSDDLSVERGRCSGRRHCRRLRPIHSLRDSCLCLLVLLVAVIVIAAVFTLAFFVLRDLSEKWPGSDETSQSTEIHGLPPGGGNIQGGQHVDQKLYPDVESHARETDWYHSSIADTMNETPEPQTTTSSSDSSWSSTSSSGSESAIGTDIELSASDQPVKQHEPSHEPRPPAPAPTFDPQITALFTSVSETEEEIDEIEEGVSSFSPGQPATLSDGPLSGQFPSGEVHSGVWSPPASSWNEEGTPGPPAPVPSAPAQSQGPLRATDTDRDTDHFTPVSAPGQGVSPVGSAPRDNAVELDLLGSTTPAGLGPQPIAPEADGEYSTDQVNYSKAPGEALSSSWSGEDDSEALVTVMDGPDKQLSSFDTTRHGTSNDQETDPWSPVAPVRLGLTPTVSSVADEFSIDSLVALKAPDGVALLSSSSSWSSSSPLSSPPSQPNDIDSEDDIMIDTTDVPGEGLSPLIQDVHSGHPEDSMFAGVAEDNKLLSRVPSPLHDDGSDVLVAVDSPEIGLPPTSPEETSVGGHDPLADVAKSTSLFLLRPSSGGAMEPIHPTDSSGRTSSASSFSFSGDEPKYPSGANTPGNVPFTLTSTSNTGVALDTPTTESKSSGAWHTLTSSSGEEPLIPTYGEDAAPTHAEDTQPNASVSGQGSPIEAAPYARLPPDLAAGSEFEQGPDRSAPDGPETPPQQSDLSPRDVVSRGLAESSPKDQETASHGADNPLESADSEAPSKEQSIHGGPSRFGPGSPASPHDVVISGATQEEEISKFVAESPTLFQTAPASSGGAVATEAISSGATSSGGQNGRLRGVPHSSDSASDDRLTAPQSSEIPGSAGFSGPLGEDRASAVIASSADTAESQAARSPPTTLAGLLAGSVLTSVARDDLVRPAPASSDSDSDYGPRNSSRRRPSRPESRRRKSQQLLRTKQRQSQSQQSKRAPSQRDSQSAQNQSQKSQPTESRRESRPRLSQESQPALSQPPIDGKLSQPNAHRGQSQPDSNHEQSHQDSQQGQSQLVSRHRVSHSEFNEPVIESHSDQQHKDSEETDQSPDEFKSRPAETNLVEACVVSRLRFCDGRVPYRTTSLPNFAGASSEQQLVDSLSYFEGISDSGCSPLVAEYVCAAIEPPCVSHPAPHTLPPCRHFCHDVAANCGAEIVSDLTESQAFNCSQLPDSRDPDVCYSSTADQCVASEFACADQTACLPAAWRCDGSPQCDDHSDEMDCDHCFADQYRCRPAGGCVAREQLCDGFADCTEGDDERNCQVEEGAEFVSASSSAE